MFRNKTDVVDFIMAVINVNTKTAIYIKAYTARI